ncbi:MAG: hypothetical protein K0S88_1153, partial [Actinomycetia bacterium]|nr:hypothetical protein [Actinomycetes bacterium]
MERLAGGNGVKQQLQLPGRRR